MTNSKNLFNDLVNRISLKEERNEIQSIVYLLLDKKFGLSQTDIFGEKKIEYVDLETLNQYVDRINKNEPIQYIVGEAIFYGRTFKVNPSVLIPRPETELLVHEIYKYIEGKNEPVTILDIGTGSGCIAISLALEINNCKVAAMDISPEAIDCAKENSKVLDSPVSLIQADILNDDIPNQFDLIVSNPPYISEEEKGKMKPNVLEYEPHLALFGPKNNPLKFYNVIAEKGGQALKENGSIWVEINEHFGNEIKKIFENRNYKQVRIIKDLDNKDRIIAAFL